MADLHTSIADETAHGAGFADLMTHLGGYERVVVAFSGGVDSAFLLAAAQAALPGRVRAAIGVSPSLQRESLEIARETARDLGVPLLEIATDEFEDPRYLANEPNRCYYCKSSLYGMLEQLAAAVGPETVLDGTNQDDLREPRPGRAAAREHGVRSPLADLGWTKREIRAEAHRLGLRTWNRPASPCLSSRVPHGTAVTREALLRIELAERSLRELGYPVVRVRDHGTAAKVEVPSEDLTRLDGQRGQAEALVKEAGYETMWVDPRGYRSASADAAPGDRDLGKGNRE